MATLIQPSFQNKKAQIEQRERICTLNSSLSLSSPHFMQCRNQQKKKGEKKSISPPIDTTTSLFGCVQRKKRGGKKKPWPHSDAGIKSAQTYLTRGLATLGIQ